jgi:phenylacetate-coenzyme A ligase PaaK-like adenylate-forming protein
VGTLEGTLQRPRLAVVASSTPWHISARVGTTLHSRFIPILRLDAGESLASIVRQLNEWQPEILLAYASMAAVLAGEQAAGRMHIAPRRIVCGAEVLSPPLRRRIQAVWGNIVFNQYGATEGGVLAVECESAAVAPDDAVGAQRGLHLFEDLCIIEVVDRENRPVPPGQHGDKLLLTVLFNHTQPLIRYEVNDRVRLAAGPCSCGCALSLLTDVEGRQEEVLTVPGRSGTPIAIHPMVFYRILDAIPVRDWQIVHESEGLRLRLRGDRGAVGEAALIDSVQVALARLEAAPLAVTVEWVDDAERGQTGKAARIKSLQPARTE